MTENINHHPLSTEFGTGSNGYAMKIAYHVVSSDTGLAPNPFHGFCTQALCTPSHMNAKIEIGDWLLGVSSISEGSRNLVYAMKVTDVTCMADYSNNPKYAKKIPSPNKMPYESYSGDNMYSVMNGGSTDFADWTRRADPSNFHTSKANFRQDIGESGTLGKVRNSGLGNTIFISDQFWYFGCARIKSWDPLQSKITKKLEISARGIRYFDENWTGSYVIGLLHKITSTHKHLCRSRNEPNKSMGMYGWPKDATQSCPHNNHNQASFSCCDPAGMCCEIATSDVELNESRSC